MQSSDFVTYGNQTIRKRLYSINIYNNYTKVLSHARLFYAVLL